MMNEKPSRSTDARYLFYYAYSACIILVFPIVYRTWRKLYHRSLTTRRFVRRSGLLTPFRLLRHALPLKIRPFNLFELSAGGVLKAEFFLAAHVVACFPTLGGRYGTAAAEIGARTGWIALVDCVLLIATTTKIVPFEVVLGLSLEERERLHKWFRSSTSVLGIIHGFTYGLSHVHNAPGQNGRVLPFGILSLLLFILLPVPFSWRIFYGKWPYLLHVAAFPVVFVFLCTHTSFAYISVAATAGLYVLDKLVRGARAGYINFGKPGSWRDSIITAGFTPRGRFQSLRVPCPLHPAPGSVFFVRSSADRWWQSHRLHAVPSAMAGFLEFFISEYDHEARGLMYSLPSPEGIATPTGAAVVTDRIYLDGPYDTLGSTCGWNDYNRVLVICSDTRLSAALSVALEAAKKGRCKSIDLYCALQYRANLETAKSLFKNLLRRTQQSGTQLRLRLHARNDADHNLEIAQRRGRQKVDDDTKRDRSSTPERMKAIVSAGYRRRLKLLREHDPVIKQEAELDLTLEKSFLENRVQLQDIISEFLYGSTTASRNIAHQGRWKAHSWPKETKNSDETWAVVVFGSEREVTAAEKMFWEAYRVRLRGPSLSFYGSVPPKPLYRDNVLWVYGE